MGSEMCIRDSLQIKMREQGRPWEIGKAFDFSAPIAPLRTLDDVGELTAGAITLEVDGQVRQNSDVTHLIWSVNEVIANLSTLFTLQPGDLIFTGTPEGVGAVKPGQTLKVSIDKLPSLIVRID